jgi:hypothetical protein
MEKLNAMIRPSKVRVAVSTVAKSVRSTSSRGRDLLRQKTPICAESHNTTRDNTKTRSGKSLIILIVVPAKLMAFGDAIP